MKFDDELYWPGENPGEFMRCNRVNFYENENKKWMEREEPRYNAADARIIIAHLWGCTRDLGDLRYSQCLILLFYLSEKNAEHHGVLADAMKISYRYGDYEISRELALRTLKYSNKSDLSNSGKIYVELIREDKNSHVLDILGMVIDELSQKKILVEEDYARLLQDFAEPAKTWREYDVPKCKQKGCYETIKHIEELCFQYQAYETCLRLSGLLFIAGKEPQEHFVETFVFMGKVAFENGYEEIARQCFTFVEAEACDKLGNVEEKYRAILQKRTTMIIPEVAYETDQNILEKLDKGEIKLYTHDEVVEYIRNKMPKALKQQKKEQKQREQIRQDVKERYDMIADRPQEEVLLEVEALLQMLGEDDNRCAVAGALYRKKGEIYLGLDEEQKAVECFYVAYQCEEGRFNPELMRDFALLAERTGKNKEAAVFYFRAALLS